MTAFLTGIDPAVTSYMGGSTPESGIHESISWGNDTLAQIQGSDASAHGTYPLAHVVATANQYPEHIASVPGGAHALSFLQSAHGIATDNSAANNFGAGESDVYAGAQGNDLSTIPVGVATAVDQTLGLTQAQQWLTGLTNNAEMALVAIVLVAIGVWVVVK